MWIIQSGEHYPLVHGWLRVATLPWDKSLLYTFVTLEPASLSYLRVYDLNDKEMSPCLIMKGTLCLGKSQGSKCQMKLSKIGQTSHLRRVGSRRLSTTHTHTYIYIYGWIWSRVPCSYRPPNGMGPQVAPPFPSICKLLAAFLRSSLAFARFLQRFWLPASHLRGTCYLLDDLRSSHTPSKYLRATYSHIYMCYVSTSYIYIHNIYIHT